MVIVLSQNEAVKAILALLYYSMPICIYTYVGVYTLRRGALIHLLYLISHRTVLNPEQYSPPKRSMVVIYLRRSLVGTEAVHMLIVLLYYTE